jgi:hypothetical protein
MELHPHIKMGVIMMQAEKRRRYLPIPLCLLPGYVFVLFNNVRDDRKTSPLPEISAIRIAPNAKNIRKWQVLKACHFL